MAAWLSFLGGLVLIVCVLLILTRLSTQVLQSTLSESTDTAAATDTATSTDAEASTDTIASTDTATSTARETPSTDSNGASPDAEPSTGTTERDGRTPASTTNGMKTADQMPVDKGHPQSPRSPDSTSPTDQQLASSVDQHPPASSTTLSTPALWANVVATQGLFGLVLVGLAWYTGVPAAAVGLATEYVSASAVSIGVAVGVVFYALSEATTQLIQRLGTAPPTELRNALSPETAGGWVVLLGIVLPAIAIFEELLFRGAMIGALSVGFDLPLWLLAVVSSVAFGLGHSAQGRVGMVVTGLLGIGLAGVFIWTENLLVVIVAHYVINAAEFVVHEGVGGEDSQS